GRGGDQVGGAGAERGQADAGLAGEAPPGRGHEPGGLLVAREHQADARAAQRLQQGKRFLAGNPEDMVHALGLQRLDEEVGGLGHAASLTWRALAKRTARGPSVRPQRASRSARRNSCRATRRGGRSYRSEEPEPRGSTASTRSRRRPSATRAATASPAETSPVARTTRPSSRCRML